ncbi:hypothetical protein EMIHUDRAFT_255002 [Emiliania huxleyi CCMP1516]|uniref:Uncharacterized protein n=2 Tax=Emiliania huxleyi TaxID=2903 RepID=A0A0D3JII2_EMIH1|nr:hypothetical protein EMIHUDRAFT_255002 [Emiliania huxleyi CCMP1516]EOD23317.1 hypothetical protein EMIHUDRAFT_255002 [Emiliania huxleyi CCMP1516]|eukprot:XP_005775746.1 hypothetical protein EMIHUDRAFT_255002 [Emiliania huxleyi CCMP1516]
MRHSGQRRGARRLESQEAQKTKRKNPAKKNHGLRKYFFFFTTEGRGSRGFLARKSLWLCLQAVPRWREEARRAIGDVPASSWALKRQAVPRWREEARQAIGDVPASSWALKRSHRPVAPPSAPPRAATVTEAAGGPFLAKTRYHIACGRRKTACSPVWDLFVRLQKPLLNDDYAARRSICAFSAVEGMWAVCADRVVLRWFDEVAVLLKYRSNTHDVVEGTYADDPGPIGLLRKLLGGR